MKVELLPMETSERESPSCSEEVPMPFGMP
jgi:hypothetical protein